MSQAVAAPADLGVDDDGWDEAAETRWAWTQWVKAVCEEATQGHSWVLECSPDSPARLHCANCPADVDDVAVYGGETLCARLSHQGRRVTIDYGYHDWPGPGTLVVPVFPLSRFEVYRGPEHTEYESWIELEVR